MYKIVSADKNVLLIAINEVEAEVNKLKKEGWSEQGGVSVSTTKYGYATYYTVAQAMKK